MSDTLSHPHRSHVSLATGLAVARRMADSLRRRFIIVGMFGVREKVTRSHEFIVVSYVYGQCFARGEPRFFLASPR